MGLSLFLKFSLILNLQNGLLSLTFSRIQNTHYFKNWYFFEFYKNNVSVQPPRAIISIFENNLSEVVYFSCTYFLQY
jgi:hypothetical protein